MSVVWTNEWFHPGDFTVPRPAARCLLSQSVYPVVLHAVNSSEGHESFLQHKTCQHPAFPVFSSTSGTHTDLHESPLYNRNSVQADVLPFGDPVDCYSLMPQADHHSSLSSCFLAMLVRQWDWAKASIRICINATTNEIIKRRAI